MTCNECQRNFPDALIMPLETNEGSRFMCPLCALRIINEVTGLPAGTPFRGPIAKQMHAEALEHLRSIGRKPS